MAQIKDELPEFLGRSRRAEYRRGRTQLLEVVRAAQRELRRAGVIAGPLRRDWRLDEIYPVPPSHGGDAPRIIRSFFMGDAANVGSADVEVRLTLRQQDGSTAEVLAASAVFGGKTAAIVGSALLVESAFDKSYGPDEQAIHELRAFADAEARFDAWLRKGGPYLAATIASASGVSKRMYFGVEGRNVQPGAALAALEHLTQGQSERPRWAAVVADHLESRRFAGKEAVEKARYGPGTHFLFELDDWGLSFREIAAALGKLPPRTRYQHELDWEDACDKAVKATEGRVRRAREQFQAERTTREREPDVPLERLILVLFSCSVAHGARVTPHILPRESLDGRGSKSGD